MSDTPVIVLPRGRSSNHTGPTAESIPVAPAAAAPVAICQPCIYEVENDGVRARVEAPTAADLIAIIRALEDEK